jgi:hypothetical protein
LRSEAKDHRWSATGPDLPHGVRLRTHAHAPLADVGGRRSRSRVCPHWPRRTLIWPLAEDGSTTLPAWTTTTSPRATKRRAARRAVLHPRAAFYPDALQARAPLKVAESDWVATNLTGGVGVRDAETPAAARTQARGSGLRARPTAALNVPGAPTCGDGPRAPPTLSA